MRVMYIHAGKRINKDLKSDEYHVELFRDRLRLRFEVPSHRNAMQNLLLDSQSSLQMIERLPRGQILGVAIFDSTHWFDQTQHMADPWALGPFCYHICDVFRFERGVDASGQLGIWTPKEQAQNEILSQVSVRNKINEWRQRYGNRLYFGKDPNGTPSALTILQPFVEALLCGEKKVENRKRPCFRLHPSTSFYSHPRAPDLTQCRFCPTDGSKCKYWFHTKDDSRKRRAAKAIVSPPSDSDDDDVDLTETEEDYSSAEEYKREYNTRSRQKSFEAIMGNIHEFENVKTNRKRKRSANESSSDSPPTKKQKKDKKERKKHKKHKKKKKRKYDKGKWQNFMTELDVGEEGVEPLRMCWHGAIMRPEPNPLSAPRDCHLCEETISWDQYYHCDCNNLRTDYCFHHTRKLRIAAADGWQRVSDFVLNCDEAQRKSMVERIVIPPSYIKKHKKKKKKKDRVGVDRKRKKEIKREADDDIDLRAHATMNEDAIQSSTAAAEQLWTQHKPCFDPSKMKMSFAIPKDTLHNFEIKLDVDAIQNSINAIRNHPKEENRNGFATNHHVMNGGTKMDFTHFPSHITPTISNGAAAISFANILDHRQNIQAPQPQHVQAPIAPPKQPSATTTNMMGRLSLSQIFETVKNNNNTNRLTPVPSPFAPSPSPQHDKNSNNTNSKNSNHNSNKDENKSNKNQGPNMQNVYALQSLLNRTNPAANQKYNNTIAGYNVNVQNQSTQQATTQHINTASAAALPAALAVNPNPFGPVPVPPPNNENPNNNNNPSQNSTENNTTNTASTTNTQHTNTVAATSNSNTVNMTHKSTQAAPHSYYGVIPPSYQSMPAHAMPYLPVAAGPNGQQMVYMMPPPAHNMAYYPAGFHPTFYQQYQYNPQQNKPAMQVPVPQT